MSTQNIQFKLTSSTDGVVRKATFAGQPSWSDLAARIENLFSIPAAAIALSYIDSDNDEVTLNTEEELQQFYKDYSATEEPSGGPKTFAFNVRNLTDTREPGTTPRDAHGPRRSPGHHHRSLSPDFFHPYSMRGGNHRGRALRGGFRGRGGGRGGFMHGRGPHHRNHSHDDILPPFFPRADDGTPRSQTLDDQDAPQPGNEPSRPPSPPADDARDAPAPGILPEDFHFPRSPHHGHAAHAFGCRGRHFGLPGMSPRGPPPNFYFGHHGHSGPFGAFMYMPGGRCMPVPPPFHVDAEIAPVDGPHNVLGAWF